MGGEQCGGEEGICDVSVQAGPQAPGEEEARVCERG